MLLEKGKEKIKRYFAIRFILMLKEVTIVVEWKEFKNLSRMDKQADNLFIETIG